MPKSDSPSCSRWREYRSVRQGTTRECSGGERILPPPRAANMSGTPVSPQSLHPALGHARPGPIPPSGLLPSQPHPLRTIHPLLKTLSCLSLNSSFLADSPRPFLDIIRPLSEPTRLPLWVSVPTPPPSHLPLQTLGPCWQGLAAGHSACSGSRDPGSRLSSAACNS